MKKILSLVLLSMIVAGHALAQSLSFLGNSRVFLTGVSELPTRGAFVQPWQSVTVTTETFPISPGQSVTLIYTTDNWATTRELPFTFDQNVGNNSRWFCVVGPLPPGSDVQFYLRANTTNGIVRFDNNGNQNFGFVSRFSPAIRRGAILQWFATDYRTMMRRLPEVVRAGYGAIYLPPPQKSGGGGFSVGYNPYDRFDLGDRLQLGTVRTRYGTTQELQELIRMAKRMGLEVYCDLVVNHNDNRANNGITNYPGMIPEDFHIRSSADTGNNEIDFSANPGPFSFPMLNHELVGLVDIATEDGNVVQTGPFTLPAWASFNPGGKPSFIRDRGVPGYYPGGREVAEDVREYLRRWGWWLTMVIGFDGYRIDAVRHVAPSFFAPLSSQPGPFSGSRGFLPYLYSLKPSLNIFGEVLSTDAFEHREYLKTGMNMLDFILKDRMSQLFNSNGFGDIGAALSNGYGVNTALGMPFELGGLSNDLGVSFVQSHDEGPPTSNNLAHAFILTRPASAIVYYDGNNLDPNNWGQFPRPGRFDALGAGGDTVTRLVDARNRFGRGLVVNRWVSPNLYIYERQVNGQGILLVGLNIRGDFTALTQTVNTAFAPGTVLTDLSGQRPDVTVNGSGQATITVPSNSVAGNSNNARGYVIYAPRAPSAVSGIEPVTILDEAGSARPFETVATPGGTFFQGGGSFRAATVLGNSISLEIRTDGIGHTAAVRLNNGIVPSGQNVLRNTPEGLADGFMPAANAGNNTWRLDNLDLSTLGDGLHVLRVRVFANTGSRPGVFQDFVTFFYLRRSGLATMDGTLTNLGPALATQTRSASTFSNRLDALFASNDDQYLYLGLSGSVDTGEQFTNGATLLIDRDPGAGTGVRNLAPLHDDTSPVARLITNAGVSTPTGFGAEMALASFRQSTLSSAPEATVTGSPVTPFTVGAFAGLFEMDPTRPLSLRPLPSAVAWRARTSLSDPHSGLAAAIPLRTIFPNGVTQSSRVGLIAYLGTTGEAGTVFPANDARRGTIGNRPTATSWLTNQFLPVQTNIVNNPGTTSVNLTNYVTYTLRFAINAPAGVTVSAGAITVNGTRATQTVTVTNNAAGAIGPTFNLMVRPNSPQIRVANATGMSLLTANTYYLRSTTALPVGQSRQFTVNYTLPSGATITPTFSVRVGNGIP